MTKKQLFIVTLCCIFALSPASSKSSTGTKETTDKELTGTTRDNPTQATSEKTAADSHEDLTSSQSESSDNKLENEPDMEDKAKSQPKKLYLKLEPRIYNKEFSTETYGSTLRLGAVIQGNNNTTILEVGPQILNYRSEAIFSIDGVLETYWSINNKVEVYGRWYPSYVDGYGGRDFYNSVAAGAVLRLNGGIVDVSQYTGLASLTKGQYLKIEQQLSTYQGFDWSGNRTSARVGWAARGKKWSLALEAGIAYDNDIFQGKQYRPSGVFEFNYLLSRDTSMILSYYPNLNASFNGPTRGELGLAIIQRF